MEAVEEHGAEAKSAILTALLGSAVGEVVVPRTRRARRLQYFKRCERPGCASHRTMRGWVVTGPTRSSNMAEYQEYIDNKHMTPLPEEFGVELYGQEKGLMTGGTNGSRPTRYALILMHPQGMAQFPPDQIVAYGWHRQPELVKLMTPEQKAYCEAVLAQETTCPFGCDDPVRGGEPLRFVTEELRNAHLYAFHRGADMAKMTAAAIGEELRKANVNASSEMIAAVVAAVLQAFERNQPKEKNPPKPSYAEHDEKDKQALLSLLKRESAEEE